MVSFSFSADGVHPKRCNLESGGKCWPFESCCSESGAVPPDLGGGNAAGRIPTDATQSCLRLRWSCRWAPKAEVVVSVLI